MKTASNVQIKSRVKNLNIDSQTASNTENELRNLKQITKMTRNQEPLNQEE